MLIDTIFFLPAVEQSLIRSSSYSRFYFRTGWNDSAA